MGDSFLSSDSSTPCGMLIGTLAFITPLSWWDPFISFAIGCGQWVTLVKGFCSAVTHIYRQKLVVLCRQNFPMLAVFPK